LICFLQGHAQNWAFPFDCQPHKPIKGNACTKNRGEYRMSQEVNH